MEVVAVIVAAVGLTAAFVKFATTLAERQKALHEEVRQVHILVNDRMSKAISRIDQLIAALDAADVDVPEKPAD